MCCWSIKTEVTEVKVTYFLKGIVLDENGIKCWFLFPVSCIWLVILSDHTSYENISRGNSKETSPTREFSCFHTTKRVPAISGKQNKIIVVGKEANLPFCCLLLWNYVPKVVIFAIVLVIWRDTLPETTCTTQLVSGLGPTPYVMVNILY